MLCIYNAFGYEWDWQDRYRLIKEAGFEGVMLWWSDGFGRGSGYRQDVDRARKAGLMVENLHAPVRGQDDLSLDNQAGEALLECHLGCVRDCAQYQVPVVVVHLPKDRFPLSGLGMDRLKGIVELAERLGGRAAFENIFNTRNLARALREIPSERAGFCYDSCHHANDPEAPDLLEQYGNRLMALHLHDNGGERGQHQLPFDGRIDWPGVMGKIAAAGYSGPTSLEPMNWGYESLGLEEFLRRACEKGKELETLRFGK